VSPGLSLRYFVAEDPFANAKGLVKQSRDRNIANNYGMVAGSYKAFSGERTFTAANTSISSAYHITAPTKPTPAQSGNQKSHKAQVTYTMDANVTWKNSEPKVRHRNSTLARNTYATDKMLSA
jgi:hypothetical protein